LKTVELFEILGATLWENTMTEDEIVKVCSDAAKEIFKIPFLSYRLPPKAVPGIVFPTKRQKKGEVDRVSEQEARVKFIEQLNSRGLWYSIETPTEKKYRFKDSTTDGYRISARSDLSIYALDGNKLEKAVNVEFKEGNPAEKAISKDIQKFYGENMFSVWFHLLEASNKGTFKSLFAKIKKGLKEKRPKESPPINALFFFCSLKHSKKPRCWWKIVEITENGAEDHFDDINTWD